MVALTKGGVGGLGFGIVPTVKLITCWGLGKLGTPCFGSHPNAESARVCLGSFLQGISCPKGEDLKPKL